MILFKLSSVFPENQKYVGKPDQAKLTQLRQAVCFYQTQPGLAEFSNCQNLAH